MVVRALNTSDCWGMIKSVRLWCLWLVGCGGVCERECLWERERHTQICVVRCVCSVSMCPVSQCVCGFNQIWSVCLKLTCKHRWLPKAICSSLLQTCQLSTAKAHKLQTVWRLPYYIQHINHALLQTWKLCGNFPSVYIAHQPFFATNLKIVWWLPLYAYSSALPFML